MGFISKLNQNYTGFSKAGNWIKEHGTPDATILAGSKRAIRYYSGINYKEYDGRLHLPPAEKETFIKSIEQAQEPIILVVDKWEFTQPEWLYPLSEEKNKYLLDAGFLLSKIFFSEATPKQQPSPVIWIYQK